MQSCIDRIRPAVRELQALIADDPFNREMGITAETSPEEFSLRFAGKRVLLADDNELNRSVVQDLLEDSDLLVDPVATGTQAVMKIMSTPPGAYDYVLMDLMMP